MNMNPTDFIQAVDHAAGMNDRWLFLAAFCLLLLVCGVVITGSASVKADRPDALILWLPLTQRSRGTETNETLCVFMLT